MRSLENIWLLIGIIMIALLVFDFSQHPNKPMSDRIIYIFGVGLAAFMFTMRRTQRLKNKDKK